MTGLRSDQSSSRIERPALETDRLVLRPFTKDDVGDIARLAGDRAVAATTFRVPHPYTEDDAIDWVNAAARLADEGTLAAFAITLRPEGGLIGSIGLDIRREHRRAELGYWIGRPYWGRGYATEASGALIRFGFESLDLVRIYAHYMVGNGASGRVLEKCGMTFEGHLRQHIVKWGAPKDLHIYGLLRSDWEDQNQ